jgi:hypothetical protein
VSRREFKGTVRLFNLALGIFHKRHRHYQLALICEQEVTVLLLNTLCQVLTSAFNRPTQSKRITHARVESNVQDMSLAVRCDLLPEHSISVLLASTACHNERVHQENTLKIVGTFPVRHSSLLLGAYLAQSYWLKQNVVERIPFAQVFAFLLSFRGRELPLASLDYWPLALLVQKCQIKQNLSSVALLRAALASIADGENSSSFEQNHRIKSETDERADRSRILEFTHKLLALPVISNVKSS